MENTSASTWVTVSSIPWEGIHSTSAAFHVVPLSVLASVWIVVISAYHWQKSRKRQTDEMELDQATAAALDRKSDFLSRAGDAYGYSSSPCGHIDSWRKKEHPSLIGALNANQTTNNFDDSSEVYIDYAGASLPTQSHLKNIWKVSQTQILANPHSTGPAANRTKLLIEKAKKVVMDHFDCHPGRNYGLKANDGTSDTHPGYEVIFTSGTTESLRIVAERFPWSRCDTCSTKSVFVYPRSSHTSVVGIRGPALANGATFLCKSAASIAESNTETFRDWVMGSNNTARLKCDSCACSGKIVHHLLAVPAECNFGGTRLDVRSIVSKARAASGPDHRCLTLVDVAKASSTGPVNLRDLDPDFACVSFYKMFGEPTGLGALFVKRTAIDILMGQEAVPDAVGDAEKGRDAVNERPPRYFGGGSVDSMLPMIDFVVPRSEPSLLHSLVNGTVHFRGIASLPCGFKELESLGGMPKIFEHSTSLSAELARRLSSLKHRNGNAAFQLYGAWSDQPNKTSYERPGPTVTFNVLRSDGSFVGYNEVSKLAAISKPPLQLRTGCFCNPGACQEALEISDKQVLDNYFTAGHVCGDQIDLVNEKPTGAVRASFGKDSIWEDMDALVLFLEKMFVNGHETLSGLPRPTVGTECGPETHPPKMMLSELYIFPIKSCAAQRVAEWRMTRCGRLAFDREFALVDSLGHAMRLQAYPKMGILSPSIDPLHKTLTVSAPGCEDLILKLDTDSSDCDESDSNGCLRDAVVKVCGNRCGGRLWGDASVSEWFSSFLGVQCWLARHSNGHYIVPEDVAAPSPYRPRHRDVAFANEQPLLLISDHAVGALNDILQSQGQRLVSTRHFRPNFVVKSPSGGKGFEGTNPEDDWSQLLLHDKQVKLNMVGHCARCSMVDVDPTSGMKGKTLRALADYRRRNGQITFGIFLRGDQDETHDAETQAEIFLKEGDIFDCL